jgi:DNA primase catalytic subunit
MQSIRSTRAAYYANVFPSRDIFKWLSFGQESMNKTNNAFFTNREFAFVYDEVFVRYLSFKDHDSFKRTLYTKDPSEIHIGGVYEMQPQRGVENKVVGREFVIDIDMTDYTFLQTSTTEPRSEVMMYFDRILFSKSCFLNLVF